MKRVNLCLGLWGKPVVVLGAGRTGQRIVHALSTKPLDGLRPVAFFDDDIDKHGLQFSGLRVEGVLAEANSFAFAQGIQDAIVAIPSIDRKVINSLTDHEGAVFKNVQFIPDLAGLPVYGVSAGTLDNSLALEIRNELMSTTNQAFKRAIDLSGAILGTLALSPFLLVIIIAIYLDSPGPVFFGHKRLGRNGRYIRTWKFRSMVSDAEVSLREYLQKHPELRAEWEENHKLQDDPRITRVGKFIRKYSLDELPQLWNVIVGEMSLVGPRPIVDAEIEKYGNSYTLYKLVRPGMTGYWQVSGRSDTDYQNRVDLDSFYVRNWSVWLDVIIILRTFKVVIKGDGAY